MMQKPLNALNISDVEALVANQVRETRTLEFKREIVGPRDEDKREFLADVSALANTIGGDIIFGVEDIGGVASAVRPLTLSDADAEIRRLEDILRSGLEPRLPRCDLRWLAGEGESGVLVIRVPRSWAAPHRVIFRDHAKFYGRNSTGKYPLDVMELRTAFNASETLIDRIRAFRRERTNIIEANESPVLLDEGARLLFHIFPISAFTAPIVISPNETVLFRPLGAMGMNSMHTLEGFATYSGPEDADRSRSYTLVFRNGIVETAAHVGHVDERGSLLWPDSIEGNLLEVVSDHFRNLGRLNVEPPFYISLALFRVRGYSLVAGSRFFMVPRRPLRRETLIFPEILSEESNPNPQILLRPTFDLLWQAFGYQRSFSFDGEGRYVGNR